MTKQEKILVMVINDSYKHLGFKRGWHIYRNSEGFLEGYKSKKKKDTNSAFAVDISRIITTCKHLHEFSSFIKTIKRKQVIKPDPNQITITNTLKTMEKEKFKTLLKKNGISFLQENNIFIIKTQGSVDLRSLTTMPENIQFNNQGSVYLSSLTTMPENIQFNNQGSVYLSSLTTMPENIQFNNQGYVDLSSLTTMPENIQLNKKGYV